MPRTSARSAGFTLVEVMVAATLAGLVLWGVLTTNFQIIRSGVRITQYAEMEGQVRRGLEQFGADARNAIDLKWNNATSITLTVPAGGGGTRQVTYAWAASEETFYSVPGANAAVTTGRTTLVRGVPAASFSFARFDRDGKAATTDLATKRVQVNFTARRGTRIGASATESGVSATYTLRNKAVP